MTDPANEPLSTPDPVEPLVARPFTGFQPAPRRVRADLVDVARVLGVYGGSAAAGFVLLCSSMVHRPGHGASASDMAEQLRAREQARVATMQAEFEADPARVRR